MNISSKLKLRSHKEKDQTGIRRIRTDHLDHLKRLTRQPLADNSKAPNNQPYKESKQNKKSTLIKSVLGKSTANYTRLTTETSERPQYMHHNRTSTAGDKIGSSGSGNKKVGATLGSSFKKKESNKDVCYKGIKQPPTISINATGAFEPKVQLKGASRYEIQKKVGAGTFGTVHRARDKKNLDIVAIKKVYQDRNYKNRQLDILKMLSHPNVLSMKDSFFTYEQDKQYLNVVMDYYERNLYEALRKYTRKNPMPRLKFKIYSYQIFRSLLYLRHIGIAHRDIKPHNILVNQETLKLVMCDFGSAKQLKPDEPNIAYICSRCYRAPELIFGNTQYSTQIDMWSAGCVIGEILTGTPLFQGESNIDQLVEIIKVLGCPTRQQVLEMNPDHDVNKFQLPKITGKTLQKLLANSSYLGPEFIDLMKNVLSYSPSRRFTPKEALGHPFFDELRNQKVYQELQKQVGIESLFNFSETKEGRQNELQKLTPQWW